MKPDGTDLIRALANLDAGARAVIVTAATQQRDAHMRRDDGTARVWACLADLAGALSQDAPLVLDPQPVQVVGSGAPHRRLKTRVSDEDAEYGGEG